MQRRHFLGLAGAAAAGSFAPALVFADASPAKALKDDIAILREALKIHPGLYRYSSPVEIEGRLAALESAFVAAPDLAARYLLLSRFLATIRCGHSYCNFFNQSDVVSAALFGRPTRLPFWFRWVDGQMVITRDTSASLPAGTIVEMINGMPARDMLAALMPYARADGGNDGKRRSWLSVQGFESVEAFDAFQGLLYPPRRPSHEVIARTPDGAVRTLSLPAIGLEERRRTLRPRSTDDRPIWRWDMRDDGVAVLTMPDWAMYQNKWKTWREWLAERFASLKGAKALIVDIRACEGGEDCGDEILARLADRDLRFPADQQRVRYQRTPAALNPYLDTWDNSFRELGVGGKPLPGGFFERPGVGGDATIPAKGPKIPVPVAALIGPVNSSATFQFAMRGKQTGLVKLFGSETGGNRRGINGGCFFFVRLPASGIEFDLPLVGYFPGTPQPDAGVTPDVLMPDTVADIVAGRDRTMEAALDWARRV